MARRKMRRYKPSGRQLDPMMVTSNHVQRWVNGLMMGTLPLSEAREWVRSGQWFVISDQAIGALDSDGYVLYR